MNRRDVLKVVGGGIAGLFFTPIPYKVLDDTSVWTQNWPWIPTPAGGPTTFRFTSCSLCRSACGVKARFVGKNPVALAGIPHHPLGGGTLCPLGLAAHQLPYHPLRATHALRLEHDGGRVTIRPTIIDDVLDVIKSKRHNGGSVAIFDSRISPSRSALYQRFIHQVPGAAVLSYPTIEEEMLDAAGTILGVSGGSIGYDFEHARTIVSFGAPIFDGWGVHGRMASLQRQRIATGSPTIIQVESRCSTTAALADRWISLQPGTEAVLALSLAHVLIAEKLSPALPKGSETFWKLIQQCQPSRASELTGIPTDTIVSIARDLGHNGPSLVVASGDPGSGPLERETLQAFVALNVLCGSIGREGGIVRRQEIPFEIRKGQLEWQRIDELPSQSISILVLDSREPARVLPWSVIQQKLTEDALVVSLSPMVAGLAKHAHFIIPTPAPFESTEDVSSGIGDCVTTYSISSPLVNRPASVSPFDDTFGRIASAVGVSTLPTREALMLEQIQVIHSNKRGTVFQPEAGTTIAVGELSTPGDLSASLRSGGCWINDRFTAQSMPRIPALDWVIDTPKLATHMTGDRTGEQSREYPLTLVPFGANNAPTNAVCSPILTKLYQESGLRPSANGVFVNPETARAARLVEGSRAIVSTQHGSLVVNVRIDRSVSPDVVFAAVGPTVKEFTAVDKSLDGSILSLCTCDAVSPWRATPARIRKA
jgi:anaerobic selenocysteine-containing dehydrogenase